MNTSPFSAGAWGIAVLCLANTMACSLSSTGSTSSTRDSSNIDETILLTIENRSGASLWHFQYADCGASDWVEVIGSTEYVPDGADVSSIELDPGCYELYVEDEYGCWAETDTDGNVEGGLAFIWTVTASRLSCP